MAMAEANGLLSLLYWRLRDRANAVPSPVYGTLKQRFEEQARTNLTLSRELATLISALGQAGVRAFAFKGPALAQALHGNVALRESSDLDLLIPEESVTTAGEVLHACGYRALYRRSPKQQRAQARDERQLDLVNESGQRVDLHWQIAPRHLGINLNFSRLWQRRRTVSVGGEIPIFSPEDMVLAIAIHGSKHLWSRIAWLWDLAETITQAPAMDWSSVLGEARLARAMGMLLLGLLQVRDQLGVKLPEPVNIAIAARPELRWIECGAAAQQRWSQTLRLLDTPAQRAACLARFVTSSSAAEWELLALPDALFPLYSFVRLARLAGLTRQWRA